MRVTRDLAQSLNFTLKIMNSQEWSEKEDFKIADNVNIKSFTELNDPNLRGFSVDNYDIVEYEPVRGAYHLHMTDQVLYKTKTKSSYS